MEQYNPLMSYYLVEQYLCRAAEEVLESGFHKIDNIYDEKGTIYYMSLNVQ